MATAPVIGPVAGYNARVYVDTATGKKEIAQLSECTQKVAADMFAADKHASAREGWKRKLPGLKDWTATAKGFRAADDVGVSTIRAALLGSQRVLLSYDPDNTEPGNERRTGYCYIKDWGESAPTSNLTAVDISIEGDGPLEIGTVPAVTVSVSPATANVAVGETEQMTATVENTGNTDVTWTVTEGATHGTVDANGLYTAPAQVPNPATATVVATSVKDNTKSDSCVVTITAS